MVRPEDLKSPFKHLKKTAFQERILYVPPYEHIEEPFTFPGWESASFFNNSLPIKIEYCSGNGAWVAAKAQQDPSCNWVAIEKKWMRVKKIWSKMKNLQLNQLLIVCGEGYQVTKHYFPSDTVEEIFINFPDPWPKTRHFKHRIIQQSFLMEMERILKKGGKWTFVTDDEEYSEWLLKEIKRYSVFTPAYKEPYYVTEFEGYGTSYFEDLWREQGKIIRYHQFIK